MQRNDRTSALTDFKEKPEVSVILISLKAGGVGLNLTSAQRVYLMDPHWYVKTPIALFCGYEDWFIFNFANLFVFALPQESCR